MTTYIHDMVCPTEPTHGNCYPYDAGMYCPHVGHATPKNITQCFWSWPEWDTAKGTAPKPPIDQPAHPSRTRAIKVRKPRAGSPNRRRAR